MRTRRWRPSCWGCSGRLARLACGFRHEGVRREAELYPGGWKDFVMMGILRSEHTTQAKTAHRLSVAGR